MLLVLVSSIVVLGSGTPDNFTANLSKIKYPSFDYSLTITLNGFGQFAGKLLCGFLIDMLPHLYLKVTFMAWFYFVKGIFTTFLPLLFDNFLSNWCPILVSTLLGISDAGPAVITTILTREFVGEILFAQALGLSMAVSGVVGMFGPLLCGIIYDNLQDYTWAFLISGIIMQISSIITFLIKDNPGSPSGSKETVLEEIQEISEIQSDSQTEV